MSRAWADPASQVIHERVCARKQGFSYAFSHNLKGSSLHANEVHELWFDAARVQGNLVTGGSFSVEQVFADDLLGAAKMNYGVGGLENIPAEKAELLRAAANRYRSLRSDYQAFLSSMDGQSKMLESFTGYALLRTPVIPPSCRLETTEISFSSHIVESATMLLQKCEETFHLPTNTIHQSLPLTLFTNKTPPC
jgi:hypothetical protein